MTFFDEVHPLGMLDTDASTSSSLIPPRSLRPHGSRDLSANYGSNLLITPPRRPIQRLPLGQPKKHYGTYEPMHDQFVTSVDKTTINLVRISDESESDN